MLLPPFDSSHRDESNGMYYISLALILAEILFIKVFNIIWPKLRLILAKYFRNTKLITEFEINYGLWNFFNELLNNYGIT